ncbi:MAG: hypothetical protein CM15mP40_11570 [Alphaproteobacteria bacterium]|nr:MAG: hypothetical protein CM15mP40_11570 [Alphaproteobacteria bacterium]
MVVIEKNSLLIRTLSSFVMFIIFFVMVNSNNLIFLIFSQFLLFLTSWEILRMLEFKRFINKKVDGSNFLLSKFQVRKYDLILICLINFFVFLLNFPLFKSSDILFYSYFYLSIKAIRYFSCKNNLFIIRDFCIYFFK